MTDPDPGPRALDEALRAVVSDVSPGCEILEIKPLGADEGQSGAGQKGAGYGRPARVRLRDAAGQERSLVFHTEQPGPFGHDRRSDRAADMLLAFDTVNRIPGHGRALDVGAVGPRGELVSLRGAGEFYLLTTWVEGDLYADDLRRIGRERGCSEDDLGRVRTLADYLAALHAERPGGGEDAYRRAIRDLVGHGEGIFGIIDGYPDDAPGALPERIFAIERRCAGYRERLRGRGRRLVRTHGDFHPFNIVFDQAGELAVLDASRGCQGDPADDLTCLSINYLFFALEAPGSWGRGFAGLWSGFWSRYLDLTGDLDALTVAPPYFAWRALVITNPAFYPTLRPETREALLGLAERALDAGRLDPAWGDELFAGARG